MLMLLSGVISSFLHFPISLNTPYSQFATRKLVSSHINKSIIISTLTFYAYLALQCRSNISRRVGTMCLHTVGVVLNCHLEPILIPEPTPHIKLFIVTTEIVLPYSPLRIRPPPEPPPIHLHPSSPPTMRASRKGSRSLITSYFKRPTGDP